jgi:hypothetical protein
MNPDNISALFKEIRDGKLPEGATLESLDDIIDEDGNTRLLVIESGHFPPGTTAKDLIRIGHLGDAAFHRTLPIDTTVKDLAEYKLGELGFTALHMAAANGCLPSDTTAQQLMSVTTDGVTPLFFLANKDPAVPGQVAMVLQDTKSSSIAELKQIGETLQIKDPIAVAQWMAKELQRHKDLSRW